MRSGICEVLQRIYYIKMPQIEENQPVLKYVREAQYQRRGTSLL